MQPLTAGHEATLRMLQDTDAVRATLDLYREIATPAGVYLRPTDRGLTVISLDPECASMVGVGGRDDGRCYLTSIPPTRAQVQWAAQAYHRKLAGLRRRSTEEAFALACIRTALESQLVLPGGQLAFLCQEWRLVSGAGAQKIDLPALDIEAGQLAVIELKSRRAAAAEPQAARYVQLLLEHGERLLPFFAALADAMARVYGAPWGQRPVALNTSAIGRAEIWSADGFRASTRVRVDVDRE